jgi:hypothetical protein
MESKDRSVFSLFWLLVLLPLGVAGSCSVLGLDDYEGERDRLDAARAVWRAQERGDYTFVLQRSCFCGGGTEPAVVTVEGGERVSVTVVQTGEPVPAEFAQYYLTVDELFDFIEDAIDRKAHRITVEYDRDVGYPVHIFIDYEENTIDEEMGFDASAFEPRE